MTPELLFPTTPERFICKACACAHVFCVVCMCVCVCVCVCVCGVRASYVCGVAARVLREVVVLALLLWVGVGVDARTGHQAQGVHTRHVVW